MYAQLVQFRSVLADYFGVQGADAILESVSDRLNADDAIEVILEFVEIQVLRTHDTDDIAHPTGYFWRAVKNSRIDESRRRASYDNALKRAAFSQNRIDQSPELAASNAAIRLEAVHAVDAALARLDSRTERVIRMRMEGTNQSEIAKALGCATSTVCNYEKRGMAKLRGLLDDGHGDQP